jgi:hypothetical protein
MIDDEKFVTGEEHFEGASQAQGVIMSVQECRNRRHSALT